MTARHPNRVEDVPAEFDTYVAVNFEPLTGDNNCCHGGPVAVRGALDAGASLNLVHAAAQDTLVQFEAEEF